MQYGIEIEADGNGNYRTFERLGLPNVGYGSDRDIEVRPAKPLFPHEVTPWVTNVTKGLRDLGFTASRGCGLHIHLDRASMGRLREDFCLALSAWAYCASQQIVQPALYGTSVRRLQGTYAPAPSIGTIAGLARNGASNYLYAHFNAVSWHSRIPTIEVRMPSGTVCQARILRVIKALRLALVAVKRGVLADELSALRLAARVQAEASAIHAATVVHDCYSRRRYCTGCIYHGTVEGAGLEGVTAATVALGVTLDSAVKAALKKPRVRKSRSTARLPQLTLELVGGSV